MPPIRTESMPQAAVILGSAGLLPFVALSFQVVTGHPLDAHYMGPVLYALLLYGAVMLSFLGGIQCGLAVVSADPSDAWRRYGFSIVPPLLAWLAVWFNGPEGLVVLAAGIGFWGLYEQWTTGLGEAPTWFGRLRLVLALISALALAAAAKYGPF